MNATWLDCGTLPISAASLSTAGEDEVGKSVYGVGDSVADDVDGDDDTDVVEVVALVSSFMTLAASNRWKNSERDCRSMHVGRGTTGNGGARGNEAICLPAGSDLFFAQATPLRRGCQRQQTTDSFGRQTPCLPSFATLPGMKYEVEVVISLEKGTTKRSSESWIVFRLSAGQNLNDKPKSRSSIGKERRQAGNTRSGWWVATGLRVSVCALGKSRTDRRTRRGSVGCGRAIQSSRGCVP